MPEVSKIEIKKVKAFPFPVTLKIASTHVLNGQVVKMSKSGLMVETTSALISVGDKVDIEFMLPVVKDVIVCTGLVIKMFNQVAGAGSLRIAEIHFKLMPNESLEKIVSYLTAAKANP